MAFPESLRTQACVGSPTPTSGGSGGWRPRGSLGGGRGSRGGSGLVLKGRTRNKPLITYNSGRWCLCPDYAQDPAGTLKPRHMKEALGNSRVGVRNSVGAKCPGVLCSTSCPAAMEPRVMEPRVMGAPLTTGADWPTGVVPPGAPVGKLHTGQPARCRAFRTPLTMETDGEPRTVPRWRDFPINASFSTCSLHLKRLLPPQNQSSCLSEKFLQLSARKEHPEVLLLLLLLSFPGGEGRAGGGQQGQVSSPARQDAPPGGCPKLQHPYRCRKTQSCA